jgi:hypothetical protein
MNDYEKEKERRKQKALERLGTNNPRCIRCGEDDWLCLERHHIAGQAFDDLTVIVCRNCHRKLSDNPKGYPQSDQTPPDPVECIGRFLLGLADLFESLVRKLREFGRFLIEQAGLPTATAKVPS